MAILEILEREVRDKTEFSEKCDEQGDVENRDYWKAFADGVNFGIDVIKNEKKG